MNLLLIDLKLPIRMRMSKFKKNPILQYNISSTSFLSPQQFEARPIRLQIVGRLTDCSFKLLRWIEGGCARNQLPPPRLASPAYTHFEGQIL